MANAVSPGVSQAIPQPGVVPAATPGVTGRNDPADPAHAAATPPLGPGVTPAPAGGAPVTAARPVVAAGQMQHAMQCFATQALPQGLVLDQDAFVAGYKAEKMLEFHSLSDATNGSSWEQNLRRFLTSMQAETRIDTVFKAAYILATAMKESRGLPTHYQMTWDPVEETHGRQSTQAYWKEVVVRDLEGWPLGADGNRLQPQAPAAPSAAASAASAASGAAHGAHGAHGARHHAPAAHPLRPANLTDDQLPQHFPADKLIKNTYQGRGYVQLTWLENYVSLGVAIGMGNKLACDPSLVLQPEIAFKIAAVGMLDGCFTGRRRGPGRTGGNKLADYSDYVKARDIINTAGDCADQVAGYARIFETLIQNSRLA